MPISLELDNTDIYQVIKIIADNLKLNYIIDSGIKGSVNVHTSGTLRRSDLLPLLETLLKINGATMVKVGNFYQILPTTLAIKQPLPVLQERPPVPRQAQRRCPVLLQGRLPWSARPQDRHPCPGQLQGLLPRQERRLEQRQPPA